MKSYRHLVIFMIAILTIGTAHAESLNHHCSGRNQDPWQIMQTTLYNHFVDTTGFCVVTPIDADLLYEISPDLAKAFHVKEKVDLNRASTLGEVICAFMQVKYAGCSGQKYDYYKYRYSTRLIYEKYLERYPDSPYAAEMRQKGECLKQYNAWSNCLDTNDYLSVLLDYESSNCSYCGFTNIALLNNESRELAAYYVQSMWSQSNNLYDNGNYYNNGLDYNYNQNNYNNFGKHLYNKYGEDSNSGNINPNDSWIELPMNENEDNVWIEKTIKL